MSSGGTPLKTVQPIQPLGTPIRSPATGNGSSNASLPVNDLDVIQDMIDCSADRLEGLRTQCVTSATLTQKEIRTLETKLLRMFSELLLTKSRLNERLPASGLPHTSGNELKQWLRVVGLSQESLSVCLTRLSTLEQLLALNYKELKELLQNNRNCREEDIRRLTRAMQNLRKCKNLLSLPSDELSTIAASVDADMEKGNVGSGNRRETREQIIDQLFWDSWDRHNHHHRGSAGNIGISASPRSHRTLTKQSDKQLQNQTSSSGSRQSPCSDSYNCRSTSSNVIAEDGSDTQGSVTPLAITPSPPNSPFTPTSKTPSFSNVSTGGRGTSVERNSLNGTPQRTKIVGTPPPTKKHLSTLYNQQTSVHVHSALVHQQPQHQQLPPISDHTSASLSKAKGTESQLMDSSPLSSATTVISSPSSLVANVNKKQHKISGGNIRSRLHTDPSPDSHSSASSEILVDTSNSAINNSLQVPLSPCTPIVNHLGMSHSIAHRFNTVFKMTSTTCDLCQKPMFLGRKCKECKYRCHKLCEPDVPPSCCLPPEFIDEFKNAIKDQVGGGFHPTLQHTPPILNTHSPNQSVGYGTLGKGRMGITSSRHQKHGSTASGGCHADSSSPGSSCNSSSPSSPALFHLHQHQHSQHTTSEPVTFIHSSNSNIMNSSAGGSSSASSNMLSTPSSQKNASQFNFPDVTITLNCSHSAGGTTTETILSSQTNISPAHHEFSDPSSATQKASNSGGNATDNSTPMSTTVSSNTATTAVMHSNENYGAANVMSGGGGGSGAIIKPNIVGSSTNSDIINAGPSTFFHRKLSATGVDKRAPFTELSDTHKSNDSDKTVSLSGSTSASTDSDRTPVRLDSTEDADSGNWPRQNSLSLKEWDIPYSDLNMREKIGQGRFGTVHRALWHGWVAVKLLKEDYLDDEHMLEAFKLEVANFKKTRHENLVLFMGACMNPPYLAIVTSLCKGNTLYTHIHARREKFVINKTTLIAQQITQGMGYLHARGIIHKDLRTKNIFLENGKVIITDFGLFSSTKLQYDKRGLGVPSGWLCYIAPELMRCLMPCKPSEESLPFSTASDVYSFGTVWYELLCGEFPFKAQSPEAIIWQVGRGMKQTLANLQTSRDVKDILMLCWHYTPDDRPDFPKLLTMFERLPKKRLARSPSHPVQLSRSAEAIF